MHAETPTTKVPCVPIYLGIHGLEQWLHNGAAMAYLLRQRLIPFLILL